MGNIQSEFETDKYSTINKITNTQKIRTTSFQVTMVRQLCKIWSSNEYIKLTMALYLVLFTYGKQLTILLILN